MIQRKVVRVDGMSCAACSARIEKSLNALDGVTECNANFSNGRVSVSYDDESTDLEDVHERIRKAGYTVVLKENGDNDDSKKLRTSLILCFPWTRIFTWIRRAAWFSSFFQAVQLPPKKAF